MNTTAGVIRFRLPEIMQQKGIRQIRLAEKMGVSRQAISRLVNNRTQMVDLDTLAKLCNALEVRPEDLLEYSQ